MSKVEDYIRKNTKYFSNEWYDNLSQGYEPWLTPDQARKAVEIAREEIVNEVCNYIKDNLYKYLYVYNGEAGFPTTQFINDLKQTMKDE